MPPYRKAKSKKQQRKFFALARRGKMSMKDARRKSRKGKAYKRMPTRVKRRKKR